LSERVSRFHLGENCHDKHPLHHRGRRDGQRDRTTRGENGARVLTSLKGRSQAIVDRAHQAGMISASDEEIAAHAELVLSVVPPGEALALAERLRPVFERQSRRQIFMDCNAVNPSTLDRIRAAIGQDEHFLDTCIIAFRLSLAGLRRPSRSADRQTPRP
jgi:hypothetical protein